MNNDKLSYDVVIERISKGVYDIKCSKPKRLLKDRDIIDEDKSVKWNREQIEKENDKIKLYNEAIKDAKKKSSLKFENDLKAAIMSEHDLNADQASKVYRKAYEDGHSYGAKEILWNAQDLGELAEAILWLAQVFLDIEGDKEMKLFVICIVTN